MKTAARPAGLRAFRDDLVHQDAALVDRAAELRASLHDYARGNPDTGADHRFLADDLHDLARRLVLLDVHVGAVAKAFEDADAAVTLFGITYATERALAAAAAATTADAGPIDLRELLVPLTERRWYELVWGAFVCPADRLGTYRGGGAVVGPDGRLYPLVVPELEIHGRIAHATQLPDLALDPGTLGGSDGGWTTLASRRGVARIADIPGWWEQAAVFAGMTSGLDATVTSFVSPVELADLDVSPSGWPSLRRRPSSAGSLPPVPAAIDADDTGHTAGPGTRSSADPPGAPAPRGGGPAPDQNRRRRAGSRRSTDGSARSIVPPRSPAGGAAGALELVGGVARGADAVQAIDRAGWAAYQLVYETNADGRRRRAQLRLFQVIKGPHGAPATITPELGYLDGDVFATTPLRYHRSPKPTIGPADTATIGVVLERPTIRPLPPHDHRP